MNYKELTTAIQAKGYRTEENVLDNSFGLISFEVGFGKKNIWYWFTALIKDDSNKDDAYMMFRESYNTNTGRVIGAKAYKYSREIIRQLLTGVIKVYRTTTSDEDIFHVFEALDDEEAMKKAEWYCSGSEVTLWNLDELDSEYHVIRNIF